MKFHYFDENSLNEEIRTRDICMFKVREMYYFNLALYKEHNFIWEKINYMCYYIHQ